jgi:DNA-directed RNA polymerase specialized sigma subunit
MSLIEPEYAEHFREWRENPTPHHTQKLLTAVAPVIDRAVAVHVGKSHPLLASRARVMAIDGLRRYDPERGKLSTHLTRHLEGLKRVNREQTTILAVPERVALGRYHLQEAARDFRDRHGREPSDGELSDHTGFSLDQVRRARSYRPAVAEGTIESGLGESYGGTGPVGEAPRMTTWQRLVYDDLSHEDQKVVDLHLAGHENREIARRLGVSPGAVSQRKGRIQALFDQEHDLSPF